MVSLSVDYPFACEPLKEQVDSSRVIGLDYSQKELYADSEAENAQYPRFHKLIKKRQRRLNKSLARKRGRAEVDEQGNPHIQQAVPTNTSALSAEGFPPQAQCTDHQCA